MITVHVENDEKTFSSFDQAFHHFHMAVMALLERGTSWQMLETGCWMSLQVNESGVIGQLVMDWYQAKDYAHYLGLLSPDGKALRLPLRSLAPELTVCLFAGAALERNPTLISSLLGDSSVYSRKRA